jgi:hypothetical protein
MDAAALRVRIPELLIELGEEAASVSLGHDAWVVHRGSVTGYVALLAADDPEHDTFLHVKFPVVQAPRRGREALLAALLRINHDLGSYAAFSLDDGGVAWLGAGRFAADVEAAELREIVTQTARLADRYDDELIETFGQDVALA